jgi:hypothetical protein
MSVPVKAGKNYFIEYRVRSNPIVGETNWKLRLMDDKVAYKDLAKCTCAAPVANSLAEVITLVNLQEEAEADRPARGGLADRFRALRR